MDTATLIAVDSVLRTRSVRGTARVLSRPASTIAAAIARFEAEVSIGLIERAGSGLVASLEAVRLEPAIKQAAQLAQAVSPHHAIKLDALERFIQVASVGSIRRAARTMGLGQPQLTRQLAQLEATLGQTLLQRSSGGSRLTPEGKTLQMRAEALLAVWRELSGASDERFRKAAATARLGSVIPLGYESEIARQLANLAARWLAERPRAPLLVSSTTADQLMAGLKSGLFDVAFLDTARLPPDLDGEIVATSPLAVVGVRAGHTSIADALLAAPLAVPSARSGLRQSINEILATYLSDIERDALQMIEIDSIPVILNLVLHHGFVSILPQTSVSRIREDLAQLALPRRHDMNFWLCWPRDGGGATLGAALIAAIAENR